MKEKIERCDENHLKYYIQQQFWNNDLISSTPHPALSLLAQAVPDGGVMECSLTAHTLHISARTSNPLCSNVSCGQLGLAEMLLSFGQDFHLGLVFAASRRMLITLAADSVRFDPRLNVQAPLTVDDRD